MEELKERIIQNILRTQDEKILQKVEIAQKEIQNQEHCKRKRD